MAQRDRRLFDPDLSAPVGEPEPSVGELLSRLVIQGHRSQPLGPGWERMAPDVMTDARPLEEQLEHANVEWLQGVPPDVPQWAVPRMGDLIGPAERKHNRDFEWWWRRRDEAPPRPPRLSL